MKKALALIVLLVPSFAFGQSGWFSVPSGYINRNAGFGVQTRSASPGEQVALVFNWLVARDAISGRCEYIYYLGSTATDMRFQKRQFFAYIPSASDGFGITSRLLQNSDLSVAIGGGNALCIYGAPNNTSQYTILEYTVPLDLPTTFMPTIGVVVDYVLDAAINTTRLEIRNAVAP
jgi:hypothetical protein